MCFDVAEGGGGAKTLPDLCSKSVLKTYWRRKHAYMFSVALLTYLTGGLMPPKLIS